jgi:prepilin-type N-terminal cleavage/methylation domain-containing protein
VPRRPAHATISGTRRPPRGGGFTLIELLAVLVIVAVLAAVAVPTLDTVGDTRAAMAARQVLGDLTFARQRAVATGTVSWVVFDPDGETWSVLSEDPVAPGRAGATVLDDPATGRAHVRHLNVGSFVGVEIVRATFDNDVEIGFDWLGRPLNASETALASGGEVVLSGGSVVRVAATTGYAAYVSP